MAGASRDLYEHLLMSVNCLKSTGKDIASFKKEHKKSLDRYIVEHFEWFHLAL